MQLNYAIKYIDAGMFRRFISIVQVKSKDVAACIGTDFSQLKISRNSSTFDRGTRTIRFLLAIGRLVAPICRHFCAPEANAEEKDANEERCIYERTCRKKNLVFSILKIYFSKLCV